MYIYADPARFLPKRTFADGLVRLERRRAERKGQELKR